MSALFRPFFGDREETVLVTGSETLLGSHILNALAETSGKQDEIFNPSGTVFRVKAVMNNNLNNRRDDRTSEKVFNMDISEFPGTPDLHRDTRDVGLALTANQFAITFRRFHESPTTFQYPHFDNKLHLDLRRLPPP